MAMKKFIKDTEILNIFPIYLHHKEVIEMTSYCKIFIGFFDSHIESSVLPKQTRRHLARNDVVERNRRSSGHAYNFFADNTSLIEIKKNVWTDRILKLSVKCTFIQMTNVISMEISTHRRYNCARGAENIHDETTSKCAWHVTQWLASYYEDYNQIEVHDNETTYKI